MKERSFPKLYLGTPLAREVALRDHGAWGKPSALPRDKGSTASNNTLVPK